MKQSFNSDQLNRMSRQDKELLTVAPGSPAGGRVVDGDISSAIRRWKRCLKEYDVVNELFERREYESKSARRRKIVDNAKYRQKIGRYEIV